MPITVWLRRRMIARVQRGRPKTSYHWAIQQVEEVSRLIKVPQEKRNDCVVTLFAITPSGSLCYYRDEALKCNKNKSVDHKFSP